MYKRIFFYYIFTILISFFSTLTSLFIHNARTGLTLSNILEDDVGTIITHNALINLIMNIFMPMLLNLGLEEDDLTARAGLGLFYNCCTVPFSNLTRSLTTMKADGFDKYSTLTSAAGCEISVLFTLLSFFSYDIYKGNNYNFNRQRNDMPPIRPIIFRRNKNEYIRQITTRLKDEALPIPSKLTTYTYESLNLIVNRMDNFVLAIRFLNSHKINFDTLIDQYDARGLSIILLDDNFSTRCINESTRSGSIDLAINKVINEKTKLTGASRLNSVFGTNEREITKPACRGEPKIT